MRLHLHDGQTFYLKNALTWQSPPPPPLCPQSRSSTVSQLSQHSTAFIEVQHHRVFYRGFPMGRSYGQLYQGCRWSGHQLDSKSLSQNGYIRLTLPHHLPHTSMRITPSSSPPPPSPNQPHMWYISHIKPWIWFKKFITYSIQPPEVFATKLIHT